MPAQRHTLSPRKWFSTSSTAGWMSQRSRSSTCFICKVRKKLANASGGKNYIETVWGHGYMLRDPSENETKVSA